MTCGSRAAVGLLVLMGLHGSAAADDADDTRTRKFRELYEQASRVYNAKDYAAAIPYLQAAFAIQPAPQLLFNIAQAYRKLDQYNSARVYFELYRSTERDLPKEKSELIDTLVVELRERELAAQQAQVKVKVHVVEKTKLVYVRAETPLPRWLRPLGIVAGISGLGLLAGGSVLLGLNGRCSSAPILPALECEKVYATQTPGIAITVAGGGVLLLGLLTFGLSFKRPARPAVVPEPKPDKEILPALPEVLPMTLDPDVEPAPAGESTAGRHPAAGPVPSP